MGQISDVRGQTGEEEPQFIMGQISDIKVLTGEEELQFNMGQISEARLGRASYSLQWDRYQMPDWGGGATVYHGTDIHGTDFKCDTGEAELQLTRG